MKNRAQHIFFRTVERTFLALTVLSASASATLAQSDLLQTLIDQQNSGATAGESQPATGFNPLPSSPGLVEEIISAGDRADILNKAFPRRDTIWDDGIIYVCWEDMAETDEEKRLWVQEAAETTWEAESALDFRGWKQCFDESVGIRIKVEDSGPHVKQLGNLIDGMPDGMVLNFTFENWSTGCQEQIEFCIRVIAVHEFGHAIGFAHEQNRPDTPGECFAPPQGSDGDDINLTSWDPDSVMNYCNAEYNNNGELSELDKFAVREIYGDPS